MPDPDVAIYPVPSMCVTSVPTASGAGTPAQRIFGPGWVAASGSSPGAFHRSQGLP